jgi:hypothetical protein
MTTRSTCVAPAPTIQVPTKMFIPADSKSASTPTYSFGAGTNAK